MNTLHDDSRNYTNVIPNAGLNVLSSLDIFDSRENLQGYINDHFRDLFFRARDVQAEFEEFTTELSLDRDEYVRQLTTCFRSLPLAFDNESRQDLESIRLCYVDE